VSDFEEYYDGQHDIIKTEIERTLGKEIFKEFWEASKKSILDRVPSSGDLWRQFLKCNENIIDQNVISVMNPWRTWILSKLKGE